MEENNSLNLEKLNSRYLALSNRLKTEKSIVKGLEDNLKTLKSDIKILDGNIEGAKRANDSAQLKRLEEDKKIVLEQIKRVEETAEIHKEDLTELKEKVDKVLDKVRENPEIKQHIDNVLAKRYDRQNKVISKKVQENEKKKEKESKKLKSIEKLQELVANHPTLNNNLKGILQNEAEIKKLLSEKHRLESKTNRTPAEDQKIADIDNEVKNKTEKVDKNKNLMMDYIKKNKIEINEKDIDELTNNTVIGKDGQVSIDKTLKNAMKESRKNIQDIETEIGKQYKKFNINRQAIINFGHIPSEMQVENTEDKKNENNIHREGREDSKNNSESKPNWWQFIKRFKAWNKRRQQKALGDGTEEHEVASKVDTKHGEFANSLKYDVVKDIVEKQSREAQKVAKREYNEVERNNDEAR